MQDFNRPDSAMRTAQGPAVQLVNQMISDAIRLSASDIHIEPRKSVLEVRMRVDGVLQVWKNLPKDMQDICTARVKVMAELDINEKRRPQLQARSFPMIDSIVDESDLGKYQEREIFHPVGADRRRCEQR